MDFFPVFPMASLSPSAALEAPSIFVMAASVRLIIRLIWELYPSMSLNIAFNVGTDPTSYPICLARRFSSLIRRSILA